MNDTAACVECAKSRGIAQSPADPCDECVHFVTVDRVTMRIDVTDSVFLKWLHDAAMAYACHAVTEKDEAWRAAYHNLAECAESCAAYISPVVKDSLTTAAADEAGKR